jgi:hypothetical protein
MRLDVLTLGLVCLNLAAAEQTPVKPLAPAEAGQHVGERVLVEMRVRASKDRLEKRGEIYLDSERDFHDPKNLGVVITKTGAARYRRMQLQGPAAYFKDKIIRVTGTVILKDKRPRIEVDDPARITLVKKDRCALPCYFKDKIIRVTGTVILKDKRPRIEVEDPARITLVKKD